MRSTRRPTTILGLTLHLVAQTFRTAPRRSAVAAAGIAICAVTAPIWSSGCGKARVATFNIENFPKSSTQEEGAFDAIRSLDAVAIGVQEITDPSAFAAAAKRRLGEKWRFIHADRGPDQRVGVLFDSEALALISSRTIRAPEVYKGAKPAFEARFSRLGWDAIRIIVVHLKAGGDGISTRKEQLRALRPVVEEASQSGDELVLLGDFNATSDDDRGEIAALAEAADMKWASKDLACTSYWDREDGCRGSALDHLLTSGFSTGIRARGPCETEGCSPGKSCPVFHREVSDHCPVTIDLW